MKTKMKTRIFITAIFIFIAGVSFGQKNISTVQILTNPDCHSCKKKIETELVYTRGIRDAVLDMDKKIVTVKFKEKKISKKEIVQIILNLGYKADIVQNKKDCKAERSCN